MRSCEAAFIADINTVLSDITRFTAPHRSAPRRRCGTTRSGLAMTPAQSTNPAGRRPPKLTTAIKVPVQATVRRRQLLFTGFPPVHSARVEQVLSQLDSGESELEAGAVAAGDGRRPLAAGLWTASWSWPLSDAA